MIKFLVFFIILYKIIISNELENIAFDTYIKRIQNIRNKMNIEFFEYKNYVHKNNSNIDQWKCVSERFILFKTILNSVDKHERKIFITYDNMKSNKKNNNALIEEIKKFYDQYKKFKKLSLEIQTCMLRYEDISNNNKQLLEVIKR